MTVKVSAQDIKKLRDLTGISMGKCKTALVEANGDIDAATGFFIGLEEGHIGNHPRHLAFDHPHIDIVATTQAKLDVATVLSERPGQVVVFKQLQVLTVTACTNDGGNKSTGTGTGDNHRAQFLFNQRL